MFGDGKGGDWRSLPIEELSLSMRAYNVLHRSGLVTIGQVVEKSEEELLALSNFGHKCYDELREKLDELRLPPSPPPSRAT
jgi:DNA-directed RNA polymerase subunit alpha